MNRHKSDVSDNKLVKKNSLKQRFRRSSFYNLIKTTSGSSLTGSGSFRHRNGRSNSGVLTADNSLVSDDISDDEARDDGIVLRFLIENKLANLDFLQPRPSIAGGASNCTWKPSFKKQRNLHIEKQEEVDVSFSSSSSSETRYHSVYSTKNHSNNQLNDPSIHDSKMNDSFEGPCQLREDYKFIIFTIINPIGMPDPYLANYLNELTFYTKRLLQIDDTQHDFILEELQLLEENLPKMLQVDILEAFNANFKVEEQGQLYCVLWISNASKDTTNIHSMHMQSSRMVTFCESISWNEHFELNIDDCEKDILNIRFLKKNLLEGKNYLNRIRSTLKKNSDFVKYKLGDIKIDIKDIACTGYEGVFSVTEKLKCKLRLQPCYHYEQFDKMSALYTLVLFSLKEAHFQNPTETNDFPLFSSKESKVIIDIFVKQHRINYTFIEQDIIELAALLAIRIAENFSVSSTSTMIANKFKSLSKIDLTCYEAYFKILKKSLNNYISAFRQYLISDLNVQISLFPLDDKDPLNVVEHFGSDFVLTCQFILSKNIITSCNLTSIIQEKLERSVSEWVKENIKTSVDLSPIDTAFKEICSVIEKLKMAESHLQMNEIVSVFFSQFGVAYYEVVTLCLDAQINEQLCRLATHMDRLHCSFCHDFDVFGCSTIQFFLSIKGVHTSLRKYIKKGEKLQIDDYQSWFKLSIPFWVNYFKKDCLKRIDMALSLEKDLVAVNEDVKHSTSVVDIQSCFAAVIADWNTLEITDPHFITHGLVSLTEIICEGVGIYTCKVLELMEKNSFYDKINNQQFDVTDQLCISFNNILRMKTYLDLIPRDLLMRHCVTDMLVTSQIEKIGDTMMRLISDAKVEIEGKEMEVLEKIIELMATDLRRKTSIFTLNPFKEDPLELINYCEDNLPVLCRKLEPTISKVFLERILDAGLQAIDETILAGENPQYYMKLKERIVLLMNHFQDFLWTNNKMHLTEKQWTGYRHLHEKITINVLSSQELMLIYLKNVVRDMKNEEETDYGILNLNLGYAVDKDGSISIQGKVYNACGLPSVNREGHCNPYLKIGLLPSAVFTKKHSSMSKKHFFTTDPTFDHQFKFLNINKNMMEMEGVLICFSAWHFNGWLPDLFLGEHVVPLRRILQKEENYVLPLKNLGEPKNKIYRILKARAKRKDPVAMEMLKEREELSCCKKRCRLCTPAQKIVTKITGNHFKPMICT